MPFLAHGQLAQVGHGYDVLLLLQRVQGLAGELGDQFWVAKLLRA